MRVNRDGPAARARAPGRAGSCGEPLAPGTTPHDRFPRRIASARSRAAIPSRNCSTRGPRDRDSPLGQKPLPSCRPAALFRQARQRDRPAARCRAPRRTLAGRRLEHPRPAHARPSGSTRRRHPSLPRTDRPGGRAEPQCPHAHGGKEKDRRSVSDFSPRFATLYRNICARPRPGSRATSRSTAERSWPCESPVPLPCGGCRTRRGGRGRAH
jgi:hypothetical protein